MKAEREKEKIIKAAEAHVKTVRQLLPDIQTEGVVFNAFVSGAELSLSSDWIKCTDRLPEQSGDYLVVYEGEHPEISAYWLVAKTWIKNKPLEITHWMPLPASPRHCVIRTADDFAHSVYKMVDASIARESEHPIMIEGTVNECVEWINKNLQPK